MNLDPKALKQSLKKAMAEHRLSYRDIEKLTDNEISHSTVKSFVDSAHDPQLSTLMAVYKFLKRYEKHLK